MMSISTSHYREKERKEMKEKRRKEILKSAEELFIANGLTETTMAHIAEKVKISRRTLYRYYKTKEELAFEIEIKLFEEFYKFQNEVYKTLKGNGLEKIKQFYTYITEYVDDNASVIRFSGEFDHYFRGEYPYTELTDKYKKMISSNDRLIIQLIKEGQEDGTIKKDIDASLTGYTINNVILCLAQRIIIRGQHISEEQGMDARKMIDQQFKLFYYSLES